MAFAWATFGAEAAGPAGGGASPCQGGGQARPSLHGCYGRQVLNTWQVLCGDDPSYDPVMVPSLWVSTARASGIAGGLDYSVVFDLY